MLFDLTNAQTPLVDLMNKVFRLYIDQFVIVFVDDIPIYSRSWEEHETHLQIAMQTLHEHQLYAKLSRCKFWLFEVAFFGLVV